MRNRPSHVVARVGACITVVAVAVLTTASCSGDDSSATSTTSGSRPTSTTEQAPSGTSGRPSDPVLAAVALTQADAGAGVDLELLPDGDVVADQVTMDVCGADFPSEDLRTARYQQVASKGSTSLWSNESVLYRDSDAAAQAMDELRAAIAACPTDRAIPSNVEGVPDATYRFDPVPDSQTAALAPDHVASTVTMTTDGDTQTMTVVYQRRGRVLSAVYDADAAQAVALGQVAAGRLAALTPEQAGEG